MADQQIGNLHGYAAVSIGGAGNKTNLSGNTGTDPKAGQFDTDYASIAAMRTRLAAISAGYYTAARLNTLTYNDMVYAIRQNDSPDTIKDVT